MSYGKKILVIIMAMMLLAMLITACTKDINGTGDVNNGLAVSENGGDTVSNQASNVSPEYDATEGITVERADVTAEQPDNAKEFSDSVSGKLYEAFLNGTESLSIEKLEKQGGFSYGADTKFDYGKRYTLGELISTLLETRLEENDNSYKMGDLNYAFIDCGDDGDSELAIEFKAYLRDDEYNIIMVIKDVDETLELCFFTEDGYRAYNYINKKGVISIGGSNGAASHYESYYTINSDGDSCFLYSCETMSAYNLFINGEDLTDTAEKLGISDSINIFRYAFEEYSSNEYDEKSYNEYIGRNFYTYEKFDENYDSVNSSEIYEKTSPYAEFMKLVSDNVFTYDEMQEKLSERLNGFGYSIEDMKDDEPEWTVLTGY